MDATARHIDGEQQQEHRNGEVVGYNDRQQDICHREIIRRQQSGIALGQEEKLAHDAIGEQIGIERSCHEWQCYDILHTVDTRQCTQHSIDEEQGPDEKCQ